MGILSKVKSSAKSVVSSAKNEVKEHPMVAAALAGGPVAVAAVAAYQHKDEVKSTLHHAAVVVKKEAGEIKQDTISAAHTVEKGVSKVAKVATSGLQSMFMYGMVAVGAVILLKLVI